MTFGIGKGAASGVSHTLVVFVHVRVAVGAAHLSFAIGEIVVAAILVRSVENAGQRTCGYSSIGSVGDGDASIVEREVEEATEQSIGRG